MQNLVTRFIKDESGATAIEYAMLAGLIGLGIIVGANTLGSNISGKLSTVGGQVTTPTIPG